MLYHSLILPHFNCWGSKIVNGHEIHILQKKDIRGDGSEYIVHWPCLMWCNSCHSEVEL